jgi:branched-chain amino acid transport system ATP-binding protein
MRLLMAETATALDITGLVSGYGDSMILNHVDLSLMPGRILAVVGKNGMGKTTLLKTIMGFVEARRGSIHIFGENVTNTRPHLIARKRVAYVPQEKALFQDLTVEDNLDSSIN